MSAQAIEEQTAAIELIVDQDPEGQVAANVPVRWKISEEMIQTLVDRGATDPYMLLVVAAGDYELDRVMVRLKAGMTYLQMRRPGINTIHATIVWTMDKEDPVKSIVMNKNDGIYRLGLLDRYVSGLTEIDRQIEELDRKTDYSWKDSDAPSDEELDEFKRQRRELRDRRYELREQGTEILGLREYFSSINRSIEGDSIDIEVPEEMFAPPPGWLIKKLAMLYGGFWQRSGWRDQCDLRRRAWFTGLTLPFAAVLGSLICVLLAVVWVFAKVSTIMAIAVSLLFGARDLDYSVFYEWDIPNLKDVWRNANPSIWIYKKVEVETKYQGGYTTTQTEYQPRNLAFWVINPPVALVVFLLLLKFGSGAVVGGTSVFATVLFAVAVTLAGGVVGYLLSKIDLTESEEQRTIVAAEKKSRLAQELSSLTIGGSASLSALPAQQRTVRLRYLHLKASVCKPFAK